MQRLALVALLVALGAIVFEFAALSAIESDSPWLQALPALVPFAALIATVFFSTAKDAWLTELSKNAAELMRRVPAVLYLSATLAIAVAVGFGLHVSRLAGAKEGRFTVQIVERDDVPDQHVPGLPVLLEQKLKNEVLERRTDAAGRASFDVDLTDIFAVRIRRSAEPRAPVFVLASDAQVSGQTKQAFQLVRLAGIPDESWIERAPALTGAGAADQRFARLPPAFFRWRDNGRAQNVIDVDRRKVAFPFRLPGAETIIRRSAFTVGFSPLLKLPRWVAYRIVTGKSFAREPGEFIPDPALPAAYQALSSDYSGNDFDRGHLVRRQDLFGLGPRAAREVSYLTAVVPQLSFVNRRLWFALETYASAKADRGRKVYIIRGPIYAPAAGSTMVNVTLMGASLVPVPTHFFQILAIAERGTMTVEAHLIPNSYVPVETGNVAQFRTSVRSIARKTGLQLDAKLLK